LGLYLAGDWSVEIGRLACTFGILERESLVTKGEKKKKK